MFERLMYASYRLDLKKMTKETKKIKKCQKFEKKKLKSKTGLIIDQSTKQRYVATFRDDNTVWRLFVNPEIPSSITKSKK